MTRTVAITGAGAGIGAAVGHLLAERGWRVIGIDVRNAPLLADLSTPDGRRAAIDGTLERCEGRLDALVCAAGLGGTARPASRIVAVNYFGCTALLDGLHGALSRGQQPAAVAVASVSAVAGPWRDHPIERACLEGDEALACRLADAEPVAYAAYGTSKRALAVHVRRRAVAWGPSGVRLNAIAPGAVDTALHQAALDDPVLGARTRAFVPPLGRTAAPAEIAEAIAFLLSPAASYVHGTVLFADGGSDASIRPGDF